jgi:mono/diheme cytochrome c family protein
MKKIILATTLLTIAFACSRKETLPKPFTKAMLPSQIFLITTNKDTSLETVHGSIVRIAAGSFDFSGNIQIEIKEAFTPAEILAAGLVTESNGRPLRSGGMIYINASSDGKAVNLLKPINVSLPNQYYDPEMKIFKGVETDSGTINWQDPVTPDTTPQVKNWETGKALFNAKCASCHNIFKPTTGPALADIEYRGPWNNRKSIYEFIKNPPSFMATNRYTQNLKSQYGSMMTGFPDLGIEGTNAILDYIKNETYRPGAIEDEKRFNDSLNALPQKEPKDTSYYVPDSSSFSIESAPCKDDTVYIPLPKQNQSIFQENLDSLITVNDSKQKEPIKPEDMEALRNGFTDPNPTSGMYDFEIKTFGWYNVDALVEGYAGTSYVKLFAQVRVDFEIIMHVYLFCPKNKMLSVGSGKQGDKYFFNKINNSIPLFINDRAILFAFGSKGDKMYYGISEFRVQGEQTIIINVKETTEEKIRKALYSKEIEGIDLGIEKKEKKIIKRDCDGISEKPDTISPK